MVGPQDAVRITHAVIAGGEQDDKRGVVVDEGVDGAVPDMGVKSIQESS